MKVISYILYKILHWIDSLFRFFIRKSFLVWFKEFIQEDSYKKIKIFNNKVIFFIPNKLTEWRVDTIFKAEPETLNWIDNFNTNEKIIFWDIGSNIGLYSIYAALKHSDIEVVSFEPSTSNLRVLSRNISINNLENKIKINQFPLTDKENKYLMMQEGQFIEGGALNSFNENYDFEGNKFQSSQNYKIYGTSINYILKNNFLNIPNYIKIDVDGIEHLILKGASNFLNHKNIKSFSIEINENFQEQYFSTLKIMEDNNFKIKSKERSENFYTSEKFKNTFNYIFEK